MMEAIIIVGAIAAALVFFLVGSEFIGFSRGESIAFSEQAMMEDLSNRLDSLQAFNGSTVVQYPVPLEEYTLSREDNSLRLRTPSNQFGRQLAMQADTNEFSVSNNQSLCITKNSSASPSISVKEGSCKKLGVSDTFCANQRCVDGVCTPQYGESCYSPDCGCNTNICQPDYRDSTCLTGTGCVKSRCVGRKGSAEQCSFDWECGNSSNGNLQCLQSQSGGKGCCPTDRIFTGSQCKKGEKGDPCRRNSQCGGNLKCNPTHPKYSQYQKACCPDGEGWNGTQCIETYEPMHLVFVPMGFNSKSAFKREVTDQLNHWIPDTPHSELPFCTNVNDCVEWASAGDTKSAKPIHAHIVSPGNAGSATPACSGPAINSVVSVANSNVQENYDHAVGITKTQLSGCGGIASCGDFRSASWAKGSINHATAVDSIGIPGQEIAHNWGMDHVQPYDCADTCGGTQGRITSCTTDVDDYMSLRPMNSYNAEEYDCLKEIYMKEDWIPKESFNSKCNAHIIPEAS